MTELSQQSDLPTGATQGNAMRKRHHARVRVIQALYHWDLNPVSITDLLSNIRSGEKKPKKVDQDYLEELLSNCIDKVEQLDELYTPYLNRSVRSLDPVERSVLRLAGCELKYRLDVPKRVVINEAVELAKLYGAVDGHKFINGVVDKLANSLREYE